MGTKTTLLQTTTGHLTPEAIQELSTELSLPTEKTSAALRSVLPSLLMAITHRGPEVLGLLERNLAGPEFIRELLGNEFTDFATKLEPFTDMALYPIISLMERLVPRVVPVVRDVFGQRHLNGNELKLMLREQTELLAELVPTDISNYFGYGTKDTRLGRVSRFSEGAVRELTEYPKHSS